MSAENARNGERPKVTDRLIPNDRMRPVGEDTALFAVLEELDSHGGHMYAPDIADAVETDAKEQSVRALVRYLWCYRELLDRRATEYIQGQEHPVGSKWLYRINDDGKAVLAKSRKNAEDDD